MVYSKVFQTNVFQTNVFQFGYHVLFVNETENIEKNTMLKARGRHRFANEVEQVREPLRPFQFNIFQTNVFMQQKAGVLRALGAVKMFNENMELAEVKQRTRDVVRRVANTLNLSEARIAYRARLGIISDDINIAEVSTRLKSIFRYATETMHIIDFDGRLKLIIRFANEIMNIKEPISAFQSTIFQNNTFQTITKKGIVRAMGFVRFVNDGGLSISESPLRVTGLYKFIAENLSLSEVLHKAFGYNRFGNDIVNLSETTAKPRVMARHVAEVVSLIDFDGRFRSVVRRVAETINLTSIEKSYRDRYRHISNTVNISEAKNKVRSYIFVITDGAMNILESFKRIRTHTIKAGGTRGARLYNRIRSAKLFNRRRSTQGATRT